MYKLRQTWTPLFPNARLYGIDVKIQSNLDPAWPITATAPEQTSIHVNPNFLKKVGHHKIHNTQLLSTLVLTLFLIIIYSEALGFWNLIYD